MSSGIRKRLIVADDLAPVVGAAVALLQERFEVVGTASDGRTALEATLKLQPDLVVMDISMPVMSGIEVARELKRRANPTRIVFLTVHEDSDILAACCEAGGLGYVLKLFMENDLIPAVNAALNGRSFASRFPSGHEISLE